MTQAMAEVWKWLGTNWFSLLQTVSIVTGLAVVAKQQRDGNRQRVQNHIQRESDSVVKLYDINRELMSFAIAHPALLNVLEDEHIANPLAEKRYLQLWLNQLAQSHSYLQNSVVKPELQEELRRDLVDLMSMKIMRKHWKKHGAFYRASFQKYVNEILEKNEPPVTAAQVKSR